MFEKFSAFMCALQGFTVRVKVLTVWNAPWSSNWVGIIFCARRFLTAVLMEGGTREWRLSSALLRGRSAGGGKDREGVPVKTQN